MSKKDEALKLALGVMQNQGDVSVDEWIAVEKALREALAEQPAPVAKPHVQEPVAWINAEKRTFEWNGPVLWNTPTVAVLNKIPLYTTPPAAQRKWVGLTDEEIDHFCHLAYTGDEELVLTIQARLKEKNA